MIKELTRRVRPRWLSSSWITRTAVATLAGALVSVGALSVPAQADTCCHAARMCHKNYFCVWENANYTGRFIAKLGNGNSVNRPNVGPYLNDKITSLWNRSGGTVCVYQNINYQGEWRDIPSGESHHDLENDHFTGGFSVKLQIDRSPMNNRISSWRACTATPVP